MESSFFLVPLDCNYKINYALLLFVVPAAVIYGLYDPAEHSFFPGCPFHALTGWLCPGCGSQRAIHQLLNFRFSSAFSLNPLLIFSMPVVVLGFLLDRISNPSLTVMKCRQILFGKKSIIVMLLTIFAYWIFRNL